MRTAADRTRCRSIVCLSAALLLICTQAGSAQGTRPFSMSVGTVHVVAGAADAHLYKNSSPDHPLISAAADSDVITIFPEHLGVPFYSFTLGVPPPPDDPWTREMTALAAEARATGKPIMLQLTYARVNLVSLATNNNGTLKVSSGWAPGCVNLAGAGYKWTGKAFQKYAVWMTKLFKPKYVVTMVEPNLYYANCGRNTKSWTFIKKVANNTYNLVKRVKPNPIAFPSFNLEAIYNQQTDGFDETHYAAIADLSRDLMGIATFPWFPRNPYLLPVDYLTRIRDRHPTEKRIAITETAWNSQTINLFSKPTNTCSQYIYSDESFQADYLNFAIYSAFAGDFEMLTWWSHRDMIEGTVLPTCYPPATPPSFSECNGDFWCIGVSFDRAFPPLFTSPEFGELIFKAFGSLGLRNYDGTPKAILDNIWKRYLAMPIGPLPAS